MNTSMPGERASASTYLAGGRGGIYFRKRLGDGRGLGLWWFVAITAGVGLAWLSWP